MLQISVEPLEDREGRPSGPWQYATDYDLDGMADLGGYKMRGATAAADKHYFFSAFAHRGEDHKAERAGHLRRGHQNRARALGRLESGLGDAFTFGSSGDHRGAIVSVANLRLSHSRSV